MSSRQIISDYFKKYWVRYLAGLIIVIISTYLGTLIPRYLGIAIDLLNKDSVDYVLVRNTSIIMGVIALLSFVTRFIWRYLIFGFCRKIEFFLREHIFKHLQKLSEDYYTQNSTGDIITRSIVDVQAVRMMLGFSTIAFIDVVITGIICIINMSRSTNILVTTIVLLPIPLIIFIIAKVKKSVKERYTKVQEAISNISSKVSENITGIRVMKAFSQEEMETKVFENLSYKKLIAETKLAKASAVINPSINLIFGFEFSLFLVIGGLMMADKLITLGDFVAFNAYLLMIIGPVNNIGRIVDRWQRGVSSLKRLDKIMLSKPTIDDSKADFEIQSFSTGNIVFDNIDFSYDKEKEIFSNLTFNINDNEMLAIMGPTGCGKSTIASIIVRIWGVLDSKVFIDGKDINKIPLEILRRNVAYVPQESFLFSDTIIENIRFFDKSISDEEVYNAAKLANIHDSVISFAKGYETVVGERGMTLSGGQKQRIALARALVRKPKILLLDDCLSAVDTATEKIIIENLINNKFYSTIIIITNRISIASIADKILLLDNNGSLKGFDSHLHLKDNNEFYKNILIELDNQNILECENNCS